MEQPGPEPVARVQRVGRADPLAPIEAAPGRDRRQPVGERRAERELGDHVQLEPGVGRPVVGDQEAMGGVAGRGEPGEPEATGRRPEPFGIRRSDEDVDVAGRPVELGLATQQAPGESLAIPRPEQLVEARVRIGSVRTLAPVPLAVVLAPAARVAARGIIGQIAIKEPERAADPRRLVATEVLGRPDERTGGVSRSPARRPCARAWTSTLPRAVASTGPATTGQPAGVGRQLAEERVRAPPPTRWTTSTDRPDRRAASPDGRRVRRREAVEDAADERRPGRPAAAGPARGTRPSIRAGMSPGGRNAGSFGSIDRPAGRQLGRGRRAGAGSCSGAPARSQVRSDSWSSHRPITLRR